MSRNNIVYLSTIYCHAYEWLNTGAGLLSGFIEHLQIVTARNYRTVANSHTLQFTAVLNYVVWVCCVLTSRFLVTDLINVLCFRAHVPSG
jgi:hypothetical protein